MVSLENIPISSTCAFILTSLVGKSKPGVPRPSRPAEGPRTGRGHPQRLLLSVALNRKSQLHGVLSAFTPVISAPAQGFRLLGGSRSEIVLFIPSFGVSLH